MSAQEDTNKVILKMIFGVLAAMFLVLTGLGGYTASHVMDKVDSLSSTYFDLKTQMAVEQEIQKQRDIRLQNIETLIYSTTGQKSAPAKK